MQSLVVSIQKLDYGGYVMAYATDGETAPSQAQFAATTLQELFTQTHHLAANTFKESPLPVPVPVSAYRPHRLPDPHTPQFDTARTDQAHMPSQPGETVEDLPRVVTDPPMGSIEEQRGRTLGERMLGRNWGNGQHSIALLAFHSAIAAALWLGPIGRLMA